MANVLSLALKVTADASGLKLDPVQRALQRLGDQSDVLSGQFAKFAGESSAAGEAQKRFADRSQDLINALRDGKIGATQFATEMERLSAAADKEAAAFERAAQITEQNRSGVEKFARAQAELKEQVDAGRISQETFNRAVEKAAAGLTDAERVAAGLAERNRDIERAAAAAAAAESARTAILREGASLAASLQTVDEKRATEMARLEELLLAGAINEETYARAKDRASGAGEAAAAAEEKYAQVLREGAKLTEQYATADEKRATELARIDDLLAQGAISEQTATKARAQASGANEAAAEAEKARAEALRAASRIIEANLTPQEKYDQQIQELQGHLDAGRLSQEQFNRAAASARNDLAGVDQQAKKAGSAIESLAKNVRILSVIEIGRAIIDGLQALGNIVSGSISRITSFVSSVSASFDRFNDLSARTGIAVESLQGYSLAAKLAGVDTEQFGSAVQKLAVNIGKAAPGDQLDKSLRRINLSVTELRGLAPEQQFAAIGEAISSLPTAADRAAAAVEIFGKQGASLAPLFRDGAASIEELRAQADRLGIIVNETQIDNIASMNDAFDLARATVEGIAGQVIGNLAPAVTGVVDEFLKFIEEWSGAEGQGGTGIANAISKVLLDGAQFLAGVFDAFVGQFGGFSDTIATAADVFYRTGQGIYGVAETLRAVFNGFELAGNGLAIKLGEFLQGLGSWVSSDLENLGRDLADAGREEAKKNAAELEQAASNAATAFSNVLTGGTGTTAEAGQGAASQFIGGVRQKFEETQSPEFKINTNIEKTRESFDAFFNGIEDKTGSVADAMKEYEAAIAGAREDSEITASEIERIEELQGRVNSAISQEQAARQEAAEAAAKQAEEITKMIAASEEQFRIDSQFGGDSGRAKAAERLVAIEQEAARVEEQLRLARQEGDQTAIDAATTRLAKLDQLAAGERDIASGRRKAEQEAEKVNDKIREREEALLNKQFEIELERAKELADARTGAIKINDLREGGIGQFFATLQEDPALSEAKKQTKELQKLREDIKKLEATKVDILAGVG